MALTKKQIKQLRAMANSLKPLFYVGKNDLTESAVNQADETIEKHELIKCAVQDGSGLTAKEAMMVGPAAKGARRRACRAAERRSGAVHRQSFRAVPSLPARRCGAYPLGARVMFAPLDPVA